jgi:hypothetical protein
MVGFMHLGGTLNLYLKRIIAAFNDGLNVPDSCSITSLTIASTGFDRHSPRNYAFEK